MYFFGYKISILRTFLGVNYKLEYFWVQKMRLRRTPPSCKFRVSSLGSCRQDATKRCLGKQSNIQLRVPHLGKFIYLRFVLWCHGANRRQILGYSSPSQIPGTCDSQACFCCGDLNLGVQCNYFFDKVVD